MVVIDFPLGKMRKVFKNLPFVSVEKMGTVLVYYNIVFITVVVTVAADMPAFFYQQDFFVKLRDYALGEDAPGKTGTNDEVVKQSNFLL